MNAIIEQIYKSGVVEDSHHNQLPHNTSSVSYDTGTVLYYLIREFRPDKTLEIGLAYGLTTLFVCQALSDNSKGFHTAIDPYQHKNYQSIGLLNIERAGLNEYLRFYQSPSYQVLAQLTIQKETFDFAFIDGSHLFDFVMVDFFFVDKLLNINGVVVFDDLWMPGIRKAVSFVLKNRAYKLIRPCNKEAVPLLKRMGRLGRRILQNPFERDWKIKWIPQNVAILQKTDRDTRVWMFHKKF